MDTMLKGLTGGPLGAKALASQVNRSVEQALGEARRSMDRAEDIARYEGAIELDARIRVVHGSEEVAELEPGQFDVFADQFANWIDGQIAASEKA